jgi:hypothetical protein
VIAPGTTSRAGVLLLSGNSPRAEMRKAVMLSELLRPPVSMREIGREVGREIGDDAIRDVLASPAR